MYVKLSYLTNSPTQTTARNQAINKWLLNHQRISILFIEKPYKNSFTACLFCLYMVLISFNEM